MANQTDFTSMTPGMAVASQLQDILASRRAESRQAMLDQLNAKNIQSEMDYRTEQANSLKAYREAQAQSMANDREAQAEQRRATGAARISNLYAPGQELTPEDVGQAKKYGLGSFVNPETTDPSFQGPALPGTNPAYHPATWKGNAAQLEIQRKANDTEEAYKQASSMSKEDWEKLGPAGAELLFARMGRTAPAGIFQPHNNTPLMVFDEATGKFRPALNPDNTAIMGKEGERPIIQTRPPREPQEHYTDLGPEIGADGKPTGKRVKMDTRTGAYSTVDFNIGPKNPPRPGAVGKISDAARKTYAVAYGAWQKDPTNASAESNLKLQANNIVQEFQTKPYIKDAVRSAFADPSNRGRMFKNSPPDANDAADLKELWAILNGGQAPQ